MEPVPRVRVPVLEQRLFTDREERPAQRRIHVQRVLGPLDRSQRRAERLQLLAVVERSSAHEQVRHAPRLERVHVGARDVAPHIDEAAEQDADVPGLDRHLHHRTFATLGHRPAALAHEPVHPRADGVGKRLLDGGHGDVPDPVGIGDGEDDEAWLDVARLQAEGCRLRALFRLAPGA